MKNFSLIVMMVISSTVFSQSEKWVMSLSTNSFPGGSITTEAYSSNKSATVVNSFYQSTYKKFRIAQKKKNRKMKDHSALDALNFIKAHIEDSVYRLPLSSIDLDSADYHYLNKRDLITDSSLILNFPLFMRHAKKVVQTCDECLPVIYFQGTQIDGQRLIAQIEIDSIPLLKLNVGIMESSRLNSLQQWILVAEVYRKFNLFTKLELESYFSRERMSAEVAKYVMILKR